MFKTTTLLYPFHPSQQYIGIVFLQVYGFKHLPHNTEVVSKQLIWSLRFEERRLKVSNHCNYNIFLSLIWYLDVLTSNMFNEKINNILNKKVINSIDFVQQKFPNPSLPIAIITVFHHFIFNFLSIIFNAKNSKCNFNCVGHDKK